MCLLTFGGEILKTPHYWGSELGTKGPQDLYIQYLREIYRAVKTYSQQKKCCTFSELYSASPVSTT